MGGESDGRSTGSPKPERALLTWIGDNRGPAILIAAVVAIIAIAVISVIWWDWVRGEESNSAALRNVGLLAAVPTSLLLAIWRNSVAQSQADVALRGHLNERYQKGIELLDSERMMTRIGAVYALQDLALDHPQSHLSQVVRVLCAFARHPPDDRRATATAEEPVVETSASAQGNVGSTADEGQSAPAIGQVTEFVARQDVVAAVAAAASCVEEHRDIALDMSLELDLRGVDLSNCQLSNTCLDNANLERAKFNFAELRDVRFDDAYLAHSEFNHAHIWPARMNRAHFLSAELNHTHLGDAELRGAYLGGAELHHAWLVNADLDGAEIHGAELDHARLWITDFRDISLHGVVLTSAHFVTQLDTDVARLDHLGEVDVQSTVVLEGRVFRVAQGLTQRQLDDALADPDNPPELDHVVDAATGEQLVWRGDAPEPTVLD